MRHRGFARYGPSPRFELPPAGLCISSFAIIRKGNSFLVGMPKRHPKWEREWAPNHSVYPKKRLDREFKSWRLPSAYLRLGEHPDHALGRVMRSQLGTEKYSTSGAKVFSFYDPSSYYRGKRHWDICFVYEVKLRGPLGARPWFAKLRYAKKNELKVSEFGSAIGYLARELGLIRE